jgi:glycosyltransferase involved in cell wall biosynthesis
VYRWVRNAIAFPDSHAGWIPFAYSAGRRAIRAEKIDAVVASIGPFSSGVVAKMLSRSTGVPYVLDFRDGWLDDPYAVRPTRLHQWGHARLEKWTVSKADAVTVYGDFLQDRLAERYPSLAGRIHTLPNGYDPADLEGIVPAERSEGLHRVVYTGNLYEHHRGNFQVLLTALRELPGALRSKLEVLFVGRTYEGAQGQVAEARLGDVVRFTGYVPHAEALRYLASADAALLLVRAGDVSSLTGKVFEYLGMGLPIVACVEPGGTCAHMLRRAGQSEWICPPDNPERLARTIISLADAGWPRPDMSEVEQFSRKYNTGRLAAILDGLVGSKAPTDRRR